MDVSPVIKVTVFEKKIRQVKGHIHHMVKRVCPVGRRLFVRPNRPELK